MRDLGGFPIHESQRKTDPVRPTKREPLTMLDIQAKRFAADKAYNEYMMAHEEERLAYEKEIDELEAQRLPQYEYELAKKELGLVKYKRFTLGFAGEPGAFFYHVEMDFWRECEASYGINKWTMDEALNEMQWWYKVACEGSRNEAHHMHEPVKGQVFLPGGPVQKAKEYDKLVFHPSAPTAKKRSSTVSIKNNPLG